MTKVVLSVHVLAAILFIGPLAVATSLFPQAVVRASGGGSSLVTARLLHRVTRGYAVAGLVVPVFGLATAGRMDVLTNPWLITSIALVVVAAGVLVLLILPRQSRLLEAVEAPPPGPRRLEVPARQLTLAVGLFNLIWAVVTVLMIVRPGSTTGA
jgi:hypothetical protein